MTPEEIDAEIDLCLGLTDEQLVKRIAEALLKTTPMTVSDYIQQAATAALAAYAAANTAPAGTYLYGSAIQVATDLEGHALPLIVLAGDPTTNQATSTAKVERASLTLYFATDKEGQGDSAEVEAAAVLRMESLKLRFFAALDSSPVVEITQLRATPFHDAYAAKLTGVGVQFTLGVPAGSLACV